MNPTQSGIPPIIYLQWFGDAVDPDPEDPVLVFEVSWSLERIFDADIEYKANQPIRFDSAFEEDAQCEAQRPREMIYSLQAQLAEAVELLRQSASGIQASHENYGALFGDDHEQPESPEIVTAIRAFLAKQP